MNIFMNIHFNIHSVFKAFCAFRLGQVILQLLQAPQKPARSVFRGGIYIYTTDQFMHVQ